MKTNIINLYKVFLFTLLVFITFSLQSCGKEEVNDPSKNNNENNIPEYKKKIVGRWNRASGYNFPQGWVFFADGTCFSDNAGGDTQGEWDFNPNTNILATTVQGWQYMITLFTDYSWAGYSVGSSSKVIAFEKSEMWLTDFYRDILYHYKWSDKDKNIIQITNPSRSSNGYGIITEGRDESEINLNYIHIEKQEDNDISINVYSKSSGSSKDFYIKVKTFTVSINKNDIYIQNPTMTINNIRYTGYLK